MECPNCGSKTPEDAKFCMNCGIKLKDYIRLLESIRRLEGEIAKIKAHLQLEADVVVTPEEKKIEVRDKEEVRLEEEDRKVKAEARPAKEKEVEVKEVEIKGEKKLQDYVIAGLIKDLTKKIGGKYEELDTLEKDVIDSLIGEGYRLNGDDRVKIHELVQEVGYTGKFRIDDYLSRKVGGRKQLAILTTLLLFVAAALGENYVVPFFVEKLTNQDPVADIIFPEDGGKFAQGSLITFKGQGIDEEDGHVSESSIIWHSSIDGDIGTGSQISVSNLSVGEHLITLTVKDSKGATNSIARKITVIAHEILRELVMDKTVNIKGKEGKAYIRIWKPIIGENAPNKGWLTMENPFYRIDVNLDHSYYLLYDKVRDKDVFIYNDKVEDKLNMLTGSDIGYGDHLGENAVSFSTTARDDLDGISDYKLLIKDEENGFLLVGTEGWDFRPNDPNSGYDAVAEVMFGLFADKPYFIDATEFNNLQKLGLVNDIIEFKSPDEIAKSWVLDEEYDSGSIKGGDNDHVNYEGVWKPFDETVSSLNDKGRRPWHSGSAQFSKMFPEHVLMGNKLGGGIVFSLPQGKFRFDDSKGVYGDQVVGQWIITGETPQKFYAFSVAPVNEYDFFYDPETFEEARDSMIRICQKYGLTCPSEPLDAHDWTTKRFAYVITLVDDWYDFETNTPTPETWALAEQSLRDFEKYEDIIYSQMELTEPLPGTAKGKL